MKRGGRLRHRSDTNSTPWTDLQVRHEYGYPIKFCEVSRYFPQYDRVHVRIPAPGSFVQDAYHTTATEIHHITGGILGNRPWDKVWNLVKVSHPVHMFCDPNFGGWVVDGVALCLRCKLDKGEFDHIEACRILGFDPLGWLSVRKCEHDFAERVRHGIVRQMEQGRVSA